MEKMVKNNFKIITNNPIVDRELGQSYEIEYYNLLYEEVLKKVRDQIHAGSRLLTHPLSGSVKPNETPYKSVMVTVKQGETDQQSLEIIEKAIEACKKFDKKYELYKETVLEDFQLIDYTLISSALPSAEAWQGL